MIYECVDPPADNGIPTLRGSVLAIESFCSNGSQDLDASTRAHIRYVFEIFRELIQEDKSIFENNNYTKRQVFSPIELVAVACLISQKGAERPKGMLRGDILALRSHLREIHDDLRMSKQCWITAWRFIDTIENHRGALDGSTVRRKPPKIIKKKTQSRRPAQMSPPATADEDDRPLANQLANAAGRIIPARPARREHARSLNSPDNPSIDDNETNEIDHTASSRRFSNTPVSSPSHMSSTALPEASTAERRKPSQLSSLKRTGDGAGSERAASRGHTISDSETPLTPSAMSPTFGNAAAGHGSMTAPPSRKRVALDLGSGSSGGHELESKKARLMAGYVKQERDS